MRIKGGRARSRRARRAPRGTPSRRTATRAPARTSDSGSAMSCAEPPRVAGRLARRRRPARDPPVAERRREQVLEPEERAEHEQHVERRPADEDARVAAVRGTEAEPRTTRRTAGRRPARPTASASDALEPPLLPPRRALVEHAEPHEQRARHRQRHHERAERQRRVDVLRPPEVGVVQRAEIEVREDEREEEERGRAREQVRGRVEVPPEQLRRLALDDAVARCRLRELAHATLPPVTARAPPTGARARRSRTDRRRTRGSGRSCARAPATAAATRSRASPTGSPAPARARTRSE